MARQAEPQRLRPRLAAGPDVELAQHRGDVVVDGLLGDDQALGDLRVAQPLGDAAPSTSSSRAVRPAGFSRVRGCGPRGTPRTPRSRSRRATIRGRRPRARAPAAPRSRRARRRSSSLSASASAASYGQPISRQHSRRPAGRRRSRGGRAPRPRGRELVAQAGLAAPVRELAGRPRRAALERERERRVGQRRRRPASSPASHAASARAAATGAIRISSPVACTSACASSSGAAASASPRRARTRPSTASAQPRATGGAARVAQDRRGARRPRRPSGRDRARAAPGARAGRAARSRARARRSTRARRRGARRRASNRRWRSAHSTSVQVRAAGVLLEAVRAARGRAPLELLAPSGSPRLELGRADVGQRVDVGLACRRGARRASSARVPHATAASMSSTTIRRCATLP